MPEPTARRPPRTRGNPFYVAELVRLMAAEGRLGTDTGTLVPARVRDVVRRRVERLGPEVVRACSRSAPSPGGFTIADLVRAAGVSRAAVAAARRSRDGGRAGHRRPASAGHFDFAHGIVRDAVRDALPEQRRGALHEAVAAALTVRRDAGADVAAAQIAHHALAAARAGADPQPAWEAALEAAREAEAALGHAEAAAHYAEALEALALGAEAPAARAPRDAARARRGDVRRGRHRGRAPALLAGRGAPPAATATRRRSPTPPSASRRCSPTALVDQRERHAAQPGARAAAGGRRRRCAPASPVCSRVLEPEQERREALIDERARDGPPAAATRRRSRGCYPSAVMVNWRPERAEERARAAGGGRPCRGRTTPITARSLWAYLHRIRDALQAGDIARADADLDRARPVAHATRRSLLPLVHDGRRGGPGRVRRAPGRGGAR